MTCYLSVSVTFLDRLFHGQGDDGPEWPPSPMRVYQALISGARAGCRGIEWSEMKSWAFRWLERRQPPLIVGSAARVATRLTSFVPNNDGDKEHDRQKLLTTKLARPTRLDDRQTVHYLWPIDGPELTKAGAEVGILCAEARHLLALGWGIDQVVGNGRVLSEEEAAALPGRRWRPFPARRPGARTWRVPTKDSLKDLERVHKSFCERVVGKEYHPSLEVTKYETVQYLASNAVPPRFYAAFEFPEGVAFRQEDVAKVAAMLRSSACGCAKIDHTHPFPGGAGIYVAGHTGKGVKTPPRFSYLPLPTVGHEHADGMVRRVLVAEPFGGDGVQRDWAERRLLNADLHDNNGVQKGHLLGLWRRTSKAMVSRYVDEAREWASVTPVVLPGLDDGKQAKAEKLVLQSIRQADIPIDGIEELTLRKAPFWPGAQHPKHYFVPAYLKGLPRWHVHVTFREPVLGPIAIGAGRHSGLGIMAAR